uniref:Uncharacterized protein n=1 Tax=Cairina moschata TaxID=8855 RepID=A0A8C3CT07_CAIMO
MAGSGRGRGRAAFTFNIEAIGFSKGASLPDAVCKPPPPFPSTDNKPVPLKTGEDEDYMLALKQDFRGTMKKMPYFLAVEEEREGRSSWIPVPLELSQQVALKKQNIFSDPQLEQGNHQDTAGSCSTAQWSCQVYLLQLGDCHLGSGLELIH